MTKEQEEAIEYFKKHINYFKEQIKFIEAVDSDYYDEEYELYKNRVKQFETVLSMLKKKDKQIDLMAEYISKHDIDEDICKEQADNNCDDINREAECKDCIKQYFEKSAKEKGE